MRMTINYILSVSAKGILPEDKKIPFGELEKKFGPIQQVAGSWYLSQEGMDELIFFARRPQSHPITDKEIKELKDIFAKEERNLEIYELTER